MLPPAPVAVEQPRQKYERVLALASEVAHLETRLNETMTELNSMMKDVEGIDLPKLLVAMLKQGPSTFVNVPTLPSPRPPTFDRVIELPASMEATPPSILEAYKKRIMVLMDDDKERKSAAIIKAMKAKKQKSTIYTALSSLVNEGKLYRPVYGHYRKKG